MSRKGHSLRRRDGTVVTWEGRSGCVCVHCEVVFAGVVAFDRHLVRARRGEEALHVRPEDAGLEPDGTGKWRVPLGGRIDVLRNGERATDEGLGEAA
jgi:hypothetical protein